MKTIKQLMIFLLLMLSFAAVAQESVLKPQSEGDVNFVSGGVGEDEKQAIEAQRADYNLHLLFAQGRGEYLSNVQVNVIDGSGHVILDALADGPIMLINLKPGRYTISANLDGHVLEKKLTVNKTKATSFTFLWPG